MGINVKRIYEDPKKTDGIRILVDRIWPRGLKKEKAKLDHWLKALAPSTDLRKWFNHDPEKWLEFQKRYKKELVGADKKEGLAILKSEAKKKKVTLLFAAKDEEHNNAVVLKKLLEK